MSDLNSINLEFLNNIEPKYKYAFRYDYLHKNLISKARQSNKLIDYIHIIECSIIYCKEKIEVSRCRICSDPHQLEKSIGYISLYSKQLIAMFVSYFGCSLSVANEFFGRFKIATYTFNGSTLFDLFTSSLSYIKWINSIEKNNNPNFDSTWFGGFYFNDDDLDVFSPNIKWIREQKNWKRIAYIGATGTTLRPVHFIAIFIDVKEKEIFSYNSEHTEEKDPLNNLKIRLPEYRFINNKYCNQFKFKLCGFFALNFLENMIRAQNLHKCFAKFNIEKNRDAEIYEYQKKSVMPNNLTLLNVFREQWKLNS